MAIDPSLAHILPKPQQQAEQEKYDPSKATLPKGWINKVTVPLNGVVYYSPTYMLGAAVGPVLPYAFSTAVHGIENAKVDDIVGHKAVNFVNVGIICEEIPIPKAILQYIELRKESLKKHHELVAWDKMV